MAAFVDVFKRKEKKYRLSAQQLEYVLHALDGRMRLDGFGKTTVSSLYFDTLDRSIIERSLDKPLYKEKLRLRKYSTSSDDCVFVELKKKYKGVVYKRRVSMSSQAAKLYMSGVSYEDACARFPMSAPRCDGAPRGDGARQADGGSPVDVSLRTSSGLRANSASKNNEKAPAYRSSQIAREISAFMGRYDQLRPSMVIACERSAYFPIVEEEALGLVRPNCKLNAPTPGDLRITFDQNIRYRDCFTNSKVGEWDGKVGEWDGYLLQPGEALMEVKATGAYPKWLASALSDCGAFPASFSKYGAAYSRCVSGCAQIAG